MFKFIFALFLASAGVSVHANNNKDGSYQLTYANQFPYKFENSAPAAYSNAAIQIVQGPQVAEAETTHQVVPAQQTVNLQAYRAPLPVSHHQAQAVQVPVTVAQQYQTAPNQITGAQQQSAQAAPDAHVVQGRIAVAQEAAPQQVARVAPAVQVVQTVPTQVVHRVPAQQVVHRVPAQVVQTVPAQVIQTVSAPVEEANVEIFDPYPRYGFGYGVSSLETGDQKFHRESRDGEVVRGQYSLVDPDGSVRTVTYTADEAGFHANVDRTAPTVTVISKPVSPGIVVKPINNNQGIVVRPITSTVPISTGTTTTTVGHPFPRPVTVVQQVQPAAEQYQAISPAFANQPVQILQRY